MTKTFPSDESFNTIDWLEWKKRDLVINIDNCQKSIDQSQMSINVTNKRIESYKKGILEIEKNIQILKGTESN